MRQTSVGLQQGQSPEVPETDHGLQSLGGMLCKQQATGSVHSFIHLAVTYWVAAPDQAFRTPWTGSSHREWKTCNQGAKGSP